MSQRPAGRAKQHRRFAHGPAIRDPYPSTVVGVVHPAVRIDAHQPHSFYIDRYPAGREATLNFPDIDLRWTNDTPSPC